MRVPFAEQGRLDCPPIEAVVLNVNCRDEIIPILRALQHVYSQPQLRRAILDLIGKDVNRDSRADCGREGMDYWTILVLAAVVYFTPRLADFVAAVQSRHEGGSVAWRAVADQPDENPDATP